MEKFPLKRAGTSVPQHSPTYQSVNKKVQKPVTITQGSYKHRVDKLVQNQNIPQFEIDTFNLLHTPFPKTVYYEKFKSPFINHYRFFRIHTIVRGQGKRKEQHDNTFPIDLLCICLNRSAHAIYSFIFAIIHV